MRTPSLRKKIASAGVSSGLIPSGRRSSVISRKRVT